jgi:CheY-like chemotaxis protein
MYFPRTAQDMRKPPAEVPRGLKSTGGWGGSMLERELALTILIVEDQALISLNIEDVVRSMGACVIGCAARLSDAFTLIETAAWDAALLDIRLAQGEMVYPAAERLRAKGVPFAFVTGWNGDIDARYVDVPVVTKPFAEAELENCLRMLVGKLRQRTSEREAA